MRPVFQNLSPKNSPTKNKYSAKSNYREIGCILISLLPKVAETTNKPSVHLLFMFFVEFS